ncbi:MAG: hypothetical protein LBK54_12300 [Propionibacteriaceae bacterium]|nr:hypothetical protein [Propionibacteriaceae bacterium]
MAGRSGGAPSMGRLRVAAQEIRVLLRAGGGGASSLDGARTIVREA